MIADTKDLRRRLDERGIGYVAVSDRTTALDETEDAQIVEYESGVFGVQMRNLTAEQAIEATLGRGECHYVGDEISGGCSECRGWLDPACAYCPSCGRRVVE